MQCLGLAREECGSLTAGVCLALVKMMEIYFCGRGLLSTDVVYYFGHHLMTFPASYHAGWA